MAKFHGLVGYEETVETTPGVWEGRITERQYSGDVLENTTRFSTVNDSTNEDVNINNQISIIADPFAYKNFHTMRYVEFMGAKWKVTSAKVSRPRLILTIGGIYNGEQA